MMNTTTTISRTGYGLIVLTMTLTEWFVERFNPAENATLWLSAAIGSLALRLLFPKTPLPQSFSGWFLGFAFACLTSATALKNGWFGSSEAELVWGALGFIGDAGMQLAATLYRIVAKVLAFAEEKPGEAFDQGLPRAERLFLLIVKIKQPLLDFIGHFTPKPPTNLS